MSTPTTPITVSMLSQYLGEHNATSYSTMAMLAEVLNGEYDLEALRREILEETQP